MGALKEGIQAVGELLDMSRKARMARAREMGFAPIDGTDVLVHSPEGVAARNIAARHARALEAYGIGRRLRDQGITSERSRGFERAIHADEVPQWVFSEPEAYDAALRAGMRGEPTPTLEVGDRYGGLTGAGRSWNYRDDYPEDGTSVYGLASRETGEIVEDTDPLSLAFIRDSGGAQTRVVGTYAGGFGADGEPLLIGARSLSPDRLRFDGAAFDPAQRHSRNLLAGVGGAAVGAGLLAAPQESEAAPMGTLAKLARMRTREAWHGSPHTYDQVDLSHMGSGEGAQAYGAGYYAADAREVAEQYRDDLGRLYGRGSTLDGEDIPTWIVDEVEAGRGDKVRADFERRKAEALSRANLPNAVQPHIARMQADNADKILRQLDALESGARAQPASALYRLEIPDEDLLDWDAPLSEQPEVVRDAVLDAAFIRPEQREDMAQRLTGREAHELMRDDYGSRESVSEALRARGVLGIRYLDGSSRNAGEGTRNYVIFDDANVNVVERNGQPIEALPRGRAGGVVGPARAAAAALAAGTAGAAQANTVGSVTTVPPMYAPSASQRESAVRAEVERLQQEYARAMQGDVIEAPKYPAIAAVAEWARGVQTDVPLYGRPLESTGDVLNRIAYGDYRPGELGLSQLAGDTAWSAFELLDPGTWAAAAASELRD